MATATLTLPCVRDDTRDPCGQAASDLLRAGYAVLKDPCDLMGLVRPVFAEGPAFFAGALPAKQCRSSFDRLEGYIPFGTEYSIDPARPDLCESFDVWGRNADLPEVRVWAADCALHRRLSAAFPAYTAVAGRVVAALRSRVNPLGALPELASASYLQLNCYRPADFERDLLQDEHEDGHLLTILRPTSRGAEIKVGDRYMQQPLADDEFLIMPGSIMTVLTGGLVPPLYHQVRNDRTTAVRQSLMFFCNASVDRDIAPWIVNDSNAGLGIAAETIRHSGRFGLRPIGAVDGPVRS